MYQLVLIVMIIISMMGIREGYSNWDFDDFSGLCGKKKKMSEDNIPRFGGIPNQSQVWSLNSCGCSKIFH